MSNQSNMLDGFEPPVTNQGSRIFNYDIESTSEEEDEAEFDCEVAGDNEVEV